jgi:glyoxylase-like metal-dependent hydrolase (beta-lactamase superfamily II)
VTDRISSPHTPDLHARVYTSPFGAFEQIDGGFSPTTSTLLVGRREAVLIDAQHLKPDVQELGDLVAETGRELTTIYITHGHADHWYGIDDLVRRFPAARVVALPGVVKWIEDNEELMAAQWSALFGDRVALPTTRPATLEGSSLELEGHEIDVLELGQGDIAPSTAVYVSALGLVVPGDVIYNRIHAMLGFVDPEQSQDWLRGIDKVEELHPSAIVAGHRHPDAPHTEPARMIQETRQYIRDFEEAAAASASADELTNRMTERYPDFGNPWTLLFSAMSRFVPGLGQDIDSALEQLS